MQPTDVDFRVIGEGKWEPFKRWLAPKLVRLAAWCLTVCVAGGVIYVMRIIGPHP